MNRRPPRFQWLTDALIAALVFAVAAGIWWELRRGKRAAQLDETANVRRAQSSGTANNDPTLRTNQTSPWDDGSLPPPIGITPAGSQIDFSRTSWEDPFTPNHWKARGWLFDAHTMHTEDSEPAEATFRRRYQKLSIDLVLKPIGPAGTFEVRLSAPRTKTSMTISLSEGLVVVSADGPKQNGEILRKEFDFRMTSQIPERLRLGATGNRVILFWNGRRVLTCAQPAEQSGRELEFTFISRQAAIRISQLRIEGE